MHARNSRMISRQQRKNIVQQSTEETDVDKNVLNQPPIDLKLVLNYFFKKKSEYFSCTVLIKVSPSQQHALQHGCY